MFPSHDPELRDYYNRHHNFDAEVDWSKNNPHADESDSYVKNLFAPKKKSGKKNVGKATYWD